MAVIAIILNSVVSFVESFKSVIFPKNRKILPIDFEMLHGPLLTRSIGLSKIQQSSFQIKITCITLISILLIFLCSQSTWCSKNVLFGEVSLVSTYLDYGSKMSKNKNGQSQIVFIFHLNRSMEGRRR